MKNPARALLALLFGLALLPSVARAQKEGEELQPRAARLAQKIVILDTHIDLPERLIDSWEDVSGRTAQGEFDYVRAREGGLDVAFMSIYVSSRLDGTSRATEMADRLIDTVEAIVRRDPEKFAVVRSAAEIPRLAGQGRMLLALGMENGSPINGSLKTLRRFYDRGIRYLTLAHAKSNAISDASYDTKRPWKGLSPFGREVVREMNHLGIMVDISHLSDRAAEQVLKISSAPVIASHSSCRHFTPGWERNISDELIVAVGRAGGVVQVNFGSEFLTDTARQYDKRSKAEVDEHARSRGWKRGEARPRPTPSSTPSIIPSRGRRPGMWLITLTISCAWPGSIMSGWGRILRGWGIPFPGISGMLRRIRR